MKNIKLQDALDLLEEHGKLYFWVHYKSGGPADLLHLFTDHAALRRFAARKRGMKSVVGEMATSERLCSWHFRVDRTVIHSTRKKINANS